MNKKVLVISFSFPPHPNVGARRWAKFCKGLVKLGNDVRVIACDYGKKNVASNWTKDLECYKDKIDYLPSHYPEALENPEGIMGKIMYRLGLFYVKLFSKGNYYDRASFLRSTIKREVARRIGEGYSNIIVTCAPFKMALWVSELKEKYPSINLIVDFRDPWMDNKVLYGFTSLSNKRQTFEKEAEIAVITRADTVVSVADEMTEYFKDLKTSNDTKFVTIKNGFDSDDFIELTAQTRSKEEIGKLKLIFVGSVYNKAVHHLFELITSLDNIKTQNPGAYQKVIFEFYGNAPKDVIKQASRHANIKFMGSVSNSEIYKKVMDANGCMTFLTDEITYCFNTKFCEYLSLRKPILIFSLPGVASRYIEDNGIGYLIKPGTVERDIMNVYNDFMNNKLPDYRSLDISEFDVQTLTKQYAAILK